MTAELKRKIRDSLRLLGAIVFAWLYIPHLAIYFLGGKKDVIDSDLIRMKGQVNIRLAKPLLLLYFLHNNSYYRCVYYYRIGAVLSVLISWWRPGCKTFVISNTARVGGGISICHPYATMLNAESIGDNFSCIHCTTLGKKNGKRPIIGNNVTIGCHVCIIGGVHIGDNVTIGAGSIVVKDIPNNCIVAGVPAKIIRKIDAN